VCCSVWQRVVACGGVLHSVLKCVAVCRRVLKCVAVCCNALQCVAVCRNVLQCQHIHPLFQNDEQDCMSVSVSGGVCLCVWLYYRPICVCM